MTFQDWIPALSKSGLFAIVLALTRNLIITRLTKTVEHDFNKKLEVLRGQLRESEERLKADFQSKESEISTLRSGAMSALAARQAGTVSTRFPLFEATIFRRFR